MFMHACIFFFNNDRYSMLISGNRLVNCIRDKSFQMKNEDMLMLMNFVNSSTSMKSSETWTPICVPGISSKKYLYAYIDFLAGNLCLIMICTGQDQFFDCSKSKHNILTSLIQGHLLEPLISSMKTPSFSCADLKISPDLRHFVYRNVPCSQFTSAHFVPPYHTPEERKRLCRVYKNVREYLRSSKSANKVYFHTSNREAVLGWMSPALELYASFALTTSKAAAIAACESIKKFIKREEENLFITTLSTF